jgi:hypothetical protein
MTIMQVLTIIEMIVMLVPNAIGNFTSVLDIIRRAKAGEEITQEELDEALAKVLLSHEHWDGTANPNEEVDDGV